MGFICQTWFNKPHLERMRGMYGLDEKQVQATMRAFARYGSQADWTRYAEVAKIAAQLGVNYSTREGRLQMDPAQALIDAGGHIFHEPEEETKMRDRLRELLNP